jgi:hypothetical protein
MQGQTRVHLGAGIDAEVDAVLALAAANSLVACNRFINEVAYTGVHTESPKVDKKT